MNIAKLRSLSRIAIEKITSRVMLKKGMKDGIARRPPQVVYWIQHTACNLSCPMCNVPAMPMKIERPSWISTERMIEIVEELADMGVPNLGVSGGEPIIDPERLFAVLEAAGKRHMYIHFGTNGLLMTEDILRRFDSIGVGHISLSADGIGEIHDKVRGRKGCWENGVIKTIRIFEKVRPKNINLKINTVISDENLEGLPELVEFMAKKKYVVFLQPFDPCAYEFLTKHKDANVAHQKFPQWIPPDRFRLLEEVIDEIMSIERKYPGTLLNDEEHLKATKRYFTFNLFDKPQTCTLGFRNLWIRSNGDVGFCIYGYIGNLKHQSVTELWNSEKMIAARKKMLKCQFVCLSGCMFDPSLFSLIIKGLKTAKKLLK
jgi:MoaA/NifB/PqqE/SkfB family radical SAM enzyme